MELGYKQEIGSLFANDILMSLLRDKKYSNGQVDITLEGDLNFSLSTTSESITITINNLKPKITYHIARGKLLKNLLKVDGRLTFVKITKDNIVIGIENMPDQTLKLV